MAELFGIFLLLALIFPVVLAAIVASLDKRPDNQ